jgi:hypothetical protein
MPFLPSCESCVLFKFWDLGVSGDSQGRDQSRGHGNHATHAVIALGIGCTVTSLGLLRVPQV